MKDSPNQSSPIIEQGLKVVAPAALAVGAVLYSAGYTYRGLSLRGVGASPSLVEAGIQDTMMQGLLPCVALATLLLTLSFLSNLIAKIPITLPSLRREREPQGRGRIAIKGIGLIITYGMVAGFVGSFIDGTIMNYSMSRRCALGCYRYTTDRGQVVGFEIYHGKEQAVLVGTKAVYLVNSKSIKKIEGVNTGRWPLISVGPMF